MSGLKEGAVLKTVTMLLGALFFNASYAINPLCYETANGYGPFDYTSSDVRENKLPIVERFHFTPDVENLIRGQSSSVNGDLNYTLRASPNHHRALIAMMNYKLRHPANPNSTDAMECYLTRAITFAPKDATVRLIAGIYYQRLGKLDAALEQMDAAHTLDATSANIAYNLGLLYFDKKDLDKAEQYAKQAYDAGFPLKGLRQKLVKAGRLKNYTPPEPEKAKPAEKAEAPTEKPVEAPPEAKPPAAKFSPLPPVTPPEQP